ncbi:MAG: DUF5320 domain-containing protein [Candidatus Eisenbacteria bacterium]
MIQAGEEEPTMPGGDRTGPMGTGARTGRGAGLCGGFGMPGYANPDPGRDFAVGFGRGRGVWGRGFGGGGRGWRHGFFATGLPGWMRHGWYAAPVGYPGQHPNPDPKMEKQALASHADALQSELELVRKRLSEIETETGAE